MTKRWRNAFEPSCAIGAGTSDGDGDVSITTAPLFPRWQPFLLVCAVAGGLAVPLDPVSTPAAAVVVALLGLAGLHVWRWSRLPGLTAGEPWGARDRFVRPAAWLGLGLAVGLLFLGVLRLLVEPAIPAAGARLAAAAAVPLWRRALVIYVAAVSEEVIFRLVLLSFVSGVVMRLFRIADRTPSRNVAWAANGVSALACAAVHLPAWYAVGPLSAGLALIVLALNGAGGAVFGYLFVTRGIVAAMWAHAGADIATQLVGPLAR